MYAYVNWYIEPLLASIDEQREIRRYLSLTSDFSDVNVATDAEYQRKYKQYWQLNAARLSPDFCQLYFAILEELKQAQTVSVEMVARRLLETPTHRNGHRSLQFSFASKLAHMLDHNLPIYDSMVEAFYFLPTDTGGRNIEANLQRLLASYRFLVNEYARILSAGILAPSITRFRQRFGLGPEYTDVKVIDTLIWRYVGYLGKGAVRDGHVVYG